MNLCLTSPGLRIFLFSLWLLISLAGCNLPATAQEPETWIDQPLDGAELSLAPVTIQAHSADADGITQIEFLISEEHIGKIETGGKRFEDASVKWNPSKTGKYTIIVRAVDSKGNTNSKFPAKVNITIGDQDLALEPSLTLPAISTPALLTSTPKPNITDTPSPNIPATVTPFYAPVFEFKQNSNCRSGPSTQFDAEDVFLSETTAVIEGRTADNSWILVKKPSGNGNCWVSSITGKTSGDWQEVKVVATPRLPSTNTPKVPLQMITLSDTTGPSISNVSINPSIVQQKGCGSPDTIVVTATVIDTSGIGNVIYQITGPTTMDAGEGYLLPAGNDVFQGSIGPIGGSTGNWVIEIFATDMFQNTSQAGPWTVQVSCVQ